MLVSALFVGWKFYLISVFFNKNEFSRGEEALIYIGHIDSINKCSYLVFCKQFLSSLETYYGFALLSYRLFFGFIGRLLNMDSVSVFHLSFYIGILALLPALIFFLKNLETDKKLIAFLLFFLTLYNGGGSHGFWWVVPDFFAILLIFIVYGIILGNYKHWKILLLILVPVGFYVHTMFVYLMTTTVFFYIFYSFLRKKFDTLMLKKIAFSFFVLAVFYIPTSYYLNGNPWGPETFVLKSNILTTSTNRSPGEQTAASQTPTQQNPFPGFNTVKERYFDYIFFEYNPLFIIIFIGMLFISSYYKQYQIISLYFAALAYTLISSINENADRSLTFIWPMTFLLYAYGIWFLFKLSNEIFKNRLALTAAKTFLYLGLVIFIAINVVYSYGVNQSIYFNPQKFFE